MKNEKDSIGINSFNDFFLRLCKTEGKGNGKQGVLYEPRYRDYSLWGDTGVITLKNRL